MYPINRTAQKTLDRLADRAREAGGHVKLDAAPGVYMPLCVEWIDRDQISLAHYGELNGDAMRDPEMVFWHAADGRWYPAGYRNDYAGVDRAALEFDPAGRPDRWRPREQRGEAAFAAEWLRNISHQQGV